MFTAAYATGKTVRYYDAETGEELPGEQLGGRAYTARTLNEAGDRLGDAFFDAAGLPALVEGDNFHRIEYTWDENGHEIAVGFFGLAGEPVLNNGAFHRCEREVAGGRELAKVYFGLGGEPVVLKGYDFHRVETTFDEQGRETSVSLFGPGGEPFVNEAGVHRTEYKYDDAAKPTSITFFDGAGKKVIPEFGD